MNGDRDELARSLGSPLCAIEDAGFSARVMARVSAARERRSALEWAVILAVSACLLAFLPLTSLAGAIEIISVDLGNSLPLALAMLAIVLSISVAPIETD